jgi:hypothetical protein
MAKVSRLSAVRVGLSLPLTSDHETIKGRQAVPHNYAGQSKAFMIWWSPGSIFL